MPRLAAVLVCAECRAETDRFDRGWRAYLTVDEDAEPVEVVVYCPACAERDFGSADRGPLV